MKKYYYVKNGKQIGPLSKEEILSEGISMNTLVWCEGMTSWVRASELEDFNGTKQVLPPPIPMEHNPTSVASNNHSNGAKASTSNKKTVWIVIIAILFFLLVLGLNAFIIYSSDKGDLITQDSIIAQEQEKRIELEQKAQRESERQARILQLQSEGGKLIGLINLCGERMNEANKFNPFRTRKQKQEEMDALTKELDDYTSRLIEINAELVKLGEEPLIEADKWR